LLAERPERYDKLCIKTGNKKVFRFRHAGGGFDRNLWNTKAIHSSVNYIEYNPVRAGLVNAPAPEEWRWSSARTRYTNKGLLPDDLDIPVFMK